MCSGREVECSRRRRALASVETRRIGEGAAERDQQVGVLGRAAKFDPALQIVVGMVVVPFEETLEAIAAIRPADQDRGDARAEQCPAVLPLDQRVGAIARVHLPAQRPRRRIDERIERMVAAVGRFPPLPQWFQGPAMELRLRLQFPEALER